VIEQPSPRRIVIGATAVFTIAMVFLFALAPTAPFTRELGVCESGAVRDILLPSVIPGPMVHVPPLYWWTAAIGVRAMGWTEIALRLPSMAAAALTCAILFAWMATTLSRRAGLWAAAALLCGHFFADAARQPRMDSMLALFVTAAAIVLERATVAGLDAPSAARRRLYFALAAGMIGLGILTKGILGITLPGAVIVLYLIVRWRWRDLFRLELIATFAAGLAFGLAWYAAAYTIGGRKFLEWQLNMNLWTRFIPTEAGGAGYCANPFWYFAPHVITGFLPWSLYLPAVAVAVWPWRERAVPEPVVHALCWFAAIFLFFSSSQGKCPVYILPAFPPLAALTGWTIARAGEMGADRRVLARTFTIASLAIALGALVLASAGAGALFQALPSASELPFKLHPTDRDFLEIFTVMGAQHAQLLIAWVVASYVGAVAVYLGLRRVSASQQTCGVLIVAAAGTLFWFGAMNPALAARQTLAGFAREVAQTVPPGAQIGHIGIEDCDLYFYSPRPIEEVFRFRCDATPPVARYIVIRRQRFDAMTRAARACLKPVLESAPVDNAGSRLLVEQTPRVR
jgi:4-amino-4-deoxy-L-arabinose transferase-like glycosyltransferase